MALIGKIREKSWLLVSIVGLALFAFILSDYQSWFGQPNQMGYGSVDGENVDFRVYELAVDNFKRNDEMDAQRNQRPYGVKEQLNSENNAWNAIVDSIILQKEFDALGISVSEREFEAYLYGQDGFTVQADFASTFVDPQTGLYSEQLLRKRIEELKNSTNPDEQRTWEQVKNSLTNQRKQQKYFQILEQGVYVTNLEAKEQYVAENRSKNISFVIRRFSEIPDNDVTVNDEELKKYYEENKNDAKYTIKSNSRELKYFAIDLKPSAEDTLTFNKEMETIKTNFAQQTTTAQDSTFVIRHSENPRYLPRVAYRSENAQQKHQDFTYPAQMDSVFLNASVGTIIGPYQDKGKYRIAKVIATNNQLYSVRHILLGAQRSDSVAVQQKKKQADSLLTILNSENFESHVRRYSEDGQQSIDNGGKYENFVYEQMVPEFSNFAHENPIGTINWVQSDFGIHIIEVLNKTPGVGLAIIEKTFRPSSNTLDDINMLANDIVAELVDSIDRKTSIKEKVEMFDTIANRKGYFPMSLTIDEKSLFVSGMKTPLAEDRMIALAFNEKNKIGEVSLSPIKDEDRYLIAILAMKRDKGTPTFEAVEEAMRRDFINDKKADVLKIKLNGKKIEDIASKNDIQVQTADITFNNGSIPNGGYDPEIVGTLFSKGIKDGSTTLPLKGRNAVYVVRVNKTTNEPATKSYDNEKQSLNNQVSGMMLQSNAITALREKAAVVDNRRFLRIGIRR